MAASVILTRYRTRLRRQMNDRDVLIRGIHTDCLLNYETVKYFNGEQHEGERYREAIREYQNYEYKVMGELLQFEPVLCTSDAISPVSLNLLNLVQNFIIVSTTCVEAISADLTQFFRLWVSLLVLCLWLCASFAASRSHTSSCSSSRTWLSSTAP